MSGEGSGYDDSPDVFSADGRVFQVEYAGKSVDNGPTAVACCCVDGVVVAVARVLHTKLLETYANNSGTNTAAAGGAGDADQDEAAPQRATPPLPVTRHLTGSRLFRVDKQCGLCVCGHLPDGRALVQRAREESEQQRDVFATPISGAQLASRLGDYMHAFTMHWAYRPFGASVIIAAWGDEELAVSSSAAAPASGKATHTFPSLYVIDPSGTVAGYRATSIGKQKTLAKTELEKLNLPPPAFFTPGYDASADSESGKYLTCKDAVAKLAEILREVQEEREVGKGKVLEIEMAWVTKDTKRTFVRVPPELIPKKAEKKEE